MRAIEWQRDRRTLYRTIVAAIHKCYRIGHCGRVSIDSVERN